MALIVGERIPLAHPKRDVTSCAIAPRQTLLATGLQDGSIRIFETTSGMLLMELVGGHKAGPAGAAVNGVAWNNEANLLCSVGDDCNMILWALEVIGQGGAVKHRYLAGHGPNTRLLGCAFSPDSLLLAVCAADNELSVWGMLGRRVCGGLVGHTNWVSCLAWGNSGILVSGSYDHSVIIWGTDWKARRTIRHHRCAVTSVAVSIESTVIMSGDQDGKLFLTHVDGTALMEFRGHREGPVTGVRFMESLGLVVSCGGWQLMFWSLRGHCVRSVGLHQGNSLAMAVHEDGERSYLVTTGDDFNAVILPFEWRPDGIVPEREAGGGAGDDGDDGPSQDMNFLEKRSQSDRGTRVSDRQSAVDGGGRNSDRRSAVSGASGIKDSRSHVSDSRR